MNIFLYKSRDERYISTCPGKVLSNGTAYKRFKFIYIIFYYIGIIDKLGNPYQPIYLFYYEITKKTSTFKYCQ
jgi:hypothetical protein